MYNYIRLEKESCYMDFIAHGRKIRKARELVEDTISPMAFTKILDNIPMSIIEALTAIELADLFLAMNKHFNDGKVAAEKELHDYIGLPNGVSIWNVIGEESAKFNDGLSVADVLAARGRQIQKTRSNAV